MKKSNHEFRVGFIACGLGAGALGFVRARASLGKSLRARFVNVGGVDFDPAACRDFEYVTGGKATCADLHTMTPAELRAAWGNEAPDCVFLSPPCKGASGLISNDKAQEEKYQELNSLVAKSFFLLCETWENKIPVIIFENVPRIVTRCKRELAQARQLLRGYGYVLHEGTHECAEIGGLGAKRRRFLLIARQPAVLESYVHRPPRQRIKACGEVLGTLPLPEETAAGVMHKLPGLSWINWVRLALIPAGGDWRDLPKKGQPIPGLEAFALGGATEAQADTWKGRPGLMGVNDWQKPARTVNATMKVTGGNSFAAVADERVGVDGDEGWHHGHLKVQDWKEPARTVTSSNGAHNIADERIGKHSRRGNYGVLRWDRPAKTVRGKMSIRQAPAAVADERVEQLALAVSRNGSYGVLDWGKPGKTVTGENLPSNGPNAVADPRLDDLALGDRFGHCNKVTPWDAPAPTVTTATHPANGAPVVADPRLAIEGAFGNCYKVTRWEEPVGTITHSPAPSSGAPAVADNRVGLSENPRRHWNKYAVVNWRATARTIIGATQPDSGGQAVADPRVGDALALDLKPSAHHNVMHVNGWNEPANTVTGASRPGGGAPSIAQPLPAELYTPLEPGQPRRSLFKRYHVNPWDRPTDTVAGEGSNGTYGVADPRPGDLPGSAADAIGERVPLRCAPRAGAYGVISWQEAAFTITGAACIDNGPFAVAEPRPPKRGQYPIIIAADGTWHRPLTTLELAVLQGLPPMIDGKPLVLDGKNSSAWRERIGNAVPVQAAQAVAESILTALLASASGTWMLSSEGVWVERDTGKTEYDYEFVDETAVAS